jgi:hypothetical protein
MGLIRGVARTAVIAGTATAVSNRVSRRQAGRWADQEQQQYDQQQAHAEQYHQQQLAQQAYAQQQAPPAAAPAPAPGGGMDAKLEQLKQLADLKAQGVLSDAEFEQQKARILGG